MEEKINVVEGRQPQAEKQEGGRAFEIIVRIKSPEFHNDGVPDEDIIDCDGYMLFADCGDHTEHMSQGRLDLMSVAEGIVNDNPRNPQLMKAIMFTQIMRKKPEGEAPADD